MENVPKADNLPPKPFQFSLRTLMIAVTIFCVLLGFLVPAIRSAREASSLHMLRYGYRNIAIGMQGYSDHNYGRLPAANGVNSTGKPINSWRFWTAPYLYDIHANYDTNFPWDAPVNSRFRTYYSFLYCSLPGADNTDSHETNVLAITGPGTAFEDGKTYKPTELPDDLIIIAETRNSGFHWMEPGDLDIRTMPRTINAPDGRGIAANIGDHFHVIFVDGTVWQLSTDVPFEEVEKFLTIDAANRHDRDEVLGPYATGK